MKKNNTSDRRNFLRTAGSALVAASIPVAISAQDAESRSPQNNLKQMIVFGGIAEPNPSLPGIFGQACFQFQMRADIGIGGFGTISDPVFTEINSHFKIHSATASGDERYTYVFLGTISESQANTNDLRGKLIKIKVKERPYGNCDVSLTIEGTPVSELLLPAIQVKLEHRSTR